MKSRFNIQGAQLNWALMCTFFNDNNLPGPARRDTIIHCWGPLWWWHGRYDIYLTQTPSSCSPSPALARAPWVVIGGIALQRVWGGVGLSVKELRLRVGWSGTPIYKTMEEGELGGGGGRLWSVINFRVHLHKLFPKCDPWEKTVWSQVIF